MNTLLIGENLRYYRLKMGLTIEQVANSIDKSVNFIGNIERGSDIPSLKTLLDICNAIGASMDNILGVNLNYNMKNLHQIGSQKLINEMANMNEHQKECVYEAIQLMKRWEQIK